MTRLRLPLLLAILAAVIGVRLTRRPTEMPVVDSGAAVPLPRERASLGASADAHLLAHPDEPEWVRDLAGWIPAVPRTPAGRALAIIWAAPSTLGGLIVGLLSATRPVVRDGVLVFAGVRGLPGMLLRRGGYAATTLGHVVIARSTPSAALMAHEIAHTRQAERLGPFTGPVYWYLLARYGYARHPMERAARQAGRAARPGTGPSVPG